MEALLGWIYPKYVSDNEKPVFAKNLSEKFESRWSTALVPKSKSIMLKGMEGSVLPVWSDHGEGRVFADESVLKKLKEDGLVSLLYADNAGNETQDYPFNPNGSPLAISGFVSPDGRHTTTMFHPERVVRLWQYAYLPAHMQDLEAAPWLKMFQNAREWCDETWLKIKINDKR